MNKDLAMVKCRLRMSCAVASAAVLSAFAVCAQERVESRMFELTYASAEEVAENFNRTWRGQAETNGCSVAGDMAVPFKEANSVMVTATTSVLDDCAAMIAKVDRKPRQVYVEARFVELNNNAGYTLGIDWSSLKGFGAEASFEAGLSQQRIPENVSKYTQAMIINPRRG